MFLGLFVVLLARPAHSARIRHPRHLRPLLGLQSLDDLHDLFFRGRNELITPTVALETSLIYVLVLIVPVPVVFAIDRDSCPTALTQVWSAPVDASKPPRVLRRGVHLVHLVGGLVDQQWSTLRSQPESEHVLYTFLLPLLSVVHLLSQHISLNSIIIAS